MKDVNWPLRQAYTTALNGIDVPVYYQSAPSSYTANYIVFRSITSNDTSTKNSSDTLTNITVEIHTHGNGSNSGRICDALADEIFNRIYSIPQATLSLLGMQMVSTRLVSDTTNNVLLQGNRTYISRFITFRHNIFVDGQDGSSNPVLVTGNIFRLEFTAVGGENFVQSDLLKGKIILEAVKDGIGFAKILLSGIPTGKQAVYNSSAGTVTFATTFEPNEISYIIYKNS